MPRHLFVVAAVLVLAPASPVIAADASNGRQLAANHCAPCHIIAPGLRNEVADAPPFDSIGRKYGFDSDALANAILGPHQKMNFSPQRGEAADLAAYISTLGR